LGNSFGYCSEEYNLQVLREAHRVLKPGGIFVIDHVDGAWTRSNLSQCGWEWLDGKENLLVSRDIVINLEGPSGRQDLFYSVRLYDLDERRSPAESGPPMQAEDGRQVMVPKGGSPVDLGMMERRQLVVAQKPIKFTAADTLRPSRRRRLCPPTSGPKL
jgi:SAM-dependent methyltransferase